MKRYKIEMQELLSRVVEIEASSAEEAMDIVKEMYRVEEIVLDGADYVSTEMEELEE